MDTRTTFRAIGTAPLIVRSILLPPAVIAGALLWSVGNEALAVVVPLTILVAAWVASFIPRIAVADGHVAVRRVFSIERLNASGVKVQLVPSSVLWYSTWNLVLVSEESTHPFAWISWHRHDLSLPWGEPAPPPRALRFADQIGAAIEEAARRWSSEADGSNA